MLLSCAYWTLLKFYSTLCPFFTYLCCIFMKKKNYQCIFLMLTIASTSGAAVFPLAVFFSCSAGTSILLCPWWCICFTGNLFIFTSDYECLYLFLEHVHYPLNPSVPSPRSKLIGSTSVFLLFFSYLLGICPSVGICGGGKKKEQTRLYVQFQPSYLFIHCSYSNVIFYS